MPPGDGARRRSAARSRRTPRDRHAARRAASWSGSRQPHSPRRWNRVAAQLSSRGIPPLRRRPYRILFHPDGKSFFVSSWADGAVYLHDAGNGSEIGRIRLGPHTTDMVLSDRKVPDDESGSRYRLVVAAANTNSG